MSSYKKSGRKNWFRLPKFAKNKVKRISASIGMGLFTIAKPFLKTPKPETLPKGNRHVCLIVVAFNQVEFIKEQARLVRKFITDTDYSHIVVDNSSDKNAREEIRNFCEHEGLTYFPIPTWLGFLRYAARSFAPSQSHALAVNIFYKHFVKKHNPYIWGLIDHDIFPTKSFSVIDNVGEQPFYGTIRDRRFQKNGKEVGGWYLWPGYSFFKSEITQRVDISFTPTAVDEIILDTGGSNYKPLFSKYSPDELRFATEHIMRVSAGNGSRNEYVILTECVSYIDNATWLHTINGSNYLKPFYQDKQKLIEKYLAKVKAM